MANIEAETATSIAKTMILPAAIRYLGGGRGCGRRLDRRDQAAGRVPGRPDRRPREGVTRTVEFDLAVYARDNQLARMPTSARSPTSWRRSSPTRPVAAAEVLGDPVHQVGITPRECSGFAVRFRSACAVLPLGRGVLDNSERDAPLRVRFRSACAVLPLGKGVRGLVGWDSRMARCGSCLPEQHDP